MGRKKKKKRDTRQREEFIASRRYPVVRSGPLYWNSRANLWRLLPEWQIAGLILFLLHLLLPFILSTIVRVYVCTLGGRQKDPRYTDFRLCLGRLPLFLFFPRLLPYQHNLKPVALSRRDVWPLLHRDGFIDHCFWGKDVT